MKTQFELLRSKNVRRCEQSYRELDSWSPSTWARKMLEEAQEALEAAEDYERAEQSGDPKSIELYRFALAHEISDVLTYADLLAARSDIELWEALCNKFNVVSERVGSKVRLP